MPSPEDILTVELLRAPLFPLALLRDLATLYRFGSVPDGLSTALELSSSDTSNRSIMDQVWFTKFLGCSHDTIFTAVGTYRRTRESPNLLTRQRNTANGAPVVLTAGAQAAPQVVLADSRDNSGDNPSSIPNVITTRRGNGTSQRTHHH